MEVFVDSAISVRAAAQLLDVSEKQVQHLGRRGEVRYVARGLLDVTSVSTYQALRQGRHTRGWSGRTAWAAIALLSGRETDWLGQGQTSRLRSRLRDIDSASLIAATRNRAVIGHFEGLPSAAARIAREPGTVQGRGLRGLVERAIETNWYVDARVQAQLVRAYGLIEHARGTFVLRTVTVDDRTAKEGVTIDLITALMNDAEVLTTVDSAISEDPRERGVALRALDDILERFRSDG